jgi:hypothetical protein
LDNQRAFLENIAKQHNITRWEDWYSITHDKIVQHTGGWGLMNHYKGSVPNLLQNVFKEYPL